MDSIGGYFGLECGNNPLYYPDGINLNSCRNSIRYIIKALSIKKIHIPYYTCHVVTDAIAQEKCKIIQYNLDKDLMPCQDFSKDDFIIYNNYFGVMGQNISSLSALYPNLIVDNAQAFFSMPECRAAVYSPRKFFGLPDGGILRGRDIPILNFEQGQSIEATSHLLKRLEFGAESGYEDFVTNDSKLDNYPVQYMARLTKYLMGNINYDLTRIKRLENFNFLNNHLGTGFPIAMTTEDVPLIFPYLIENGSEVRERLISKKIFCAKYWPDVIKWCGPKTFEYYLTNNIVPLPIDQRYGLIEMERIIKTVRQ